MWTHTDLFGRIQSPKAPLRAARDRMAQTTPNELAEVFGAGLPADLLSPADEGPGSRERVYSLRVTFWTFLWQVLNPGSPCREAVRKVMAWFALSGGPDVDESDSPYCQARQRLPREKLERLLKESAWALVHQAHAGWLFHGREVKVADGTSVQMPDTPDNQKEYPQSKGQLPGCGFPLMKLVGIFSLATGALLAIATGNKHNHDLSLLRRIWDHFKPGDIFLADRGFCDFVTLAWLFIHRHVDSVIRLHQARPADFRRGKRLGPHDRLMTWDKPKEKPTTVSSRLWKKLPKQITVRLIRFRIPIPGFRTREIVLVTTLLDPGLYPAAELAQLYLRRWKIELFFRDIKTTMHMEVLRCKTPAMARKEVLMHLIAYNLVRSLMLKASSQYAQNLEHISFKGTVDSLRHFGPMIARAPTQKKRRQLFSRLIQAIAHDPLPHRPNRSEPRAVKRRPKPYALLNKPRRLMKVTPHRGKSPRK